MLQASRRTTALFRIAKEPPIRLLGKAIAAFSPTSIRVRADWDAVYRPEYLVGVLAAADQALKERVQEISVIEFGVASGNGLVTLQRHAESVEKETGVKIKVYGFDNGKGLPQSSGDYRDHPDQWRPGDYPMDEARLRTQLTDRTSLIIGNVADTLPDFISKMQTSPVGFFAVDLDLYSSTREALKILVCPGKRMLLRVPIYFDDVWFICNHRFAGELLAIEEFNHASEKVKIDHWRGIEDGRPFPENGWLKRMYVAHDLDAISKVVLDRETARM